MLCEDCGKNEAVVVIKQINNEGQSKTLYLCESCAAKNQQQSSEKFSEIVDTYTDFTLQMLSLLQNKQHTHSEEKSCPSCGLAFSEFVANNRLGCEQCYDAFRENLLPYISQVQNSYRQHVGKRPIATTKQADTIEQIEALKRKLQDAIESEAFEEAALLRDQIKVLKGGDVG